MSLPNQTSPAERLIYPLPEARAKLGGISHSGLYNLVADGSIRLPKIGRRSYVTADELEAFVIRMEARAADIQGNDKPMTAPPAAA